MACTRACWGDQRGLTEVRYPRVRVEGGGSGTVSQTGAVHDPDTVLLDVALGVALGFAFACSPPPLNSCTPAAATGSTLCRNTDEDS